MLSDLGQEQHEKILRDSVLSIEREKLEQMSSLPPDQREKFLIEQFSDLPAENRDKWLQIASMTYEERDKIFRESVSSMSTLQKQQMIRDEYSALKIEDREKLFKENFPELPAEQWPKFEQALLNDWKSTEKWVTDDDKPLQTEEEIFDMDNINDEPKLMTNTAKSFVAVTSTDRIRKISVVNNDFRPIIEPQMGSKDKSSDEDKSNACVEIKAKEEIVEEIKGTSSSKRKRRKRSIMKKKGSQRKQSNGSSSQTEVSESDVPVVEETPNQAVSTKKYNKIYFIYFFFLHSINYLSIIQGPSPIAEVEKNSIPTEQLNPPPQTDFHFFSDTEVTK